MRTVDQSPFDLGRINFASLLAITALIFLFLVVLGLGRPAFAAGRTHETANSSRAAGVTQPQFNALQS